MSGAQFWPIRHPPTPAKSTQRMERQSVSLTHLRRVMVHSPMLQLSCAQSLSTWQVQKPVGSPSAIEHDPTQKPEKIELKAERIEHWLKVGARPSQTVAMILKRAAKSAKPAASKA